ncbi:MAG TPA: extracellular solute-binding protein [Symbiobacteriaceae bacterium]|nr:extracellular solute-binding protein [Symbiobacteriaceae bacterium]
MKRLILVLVAVALLGCTGQVPVKKTGETPVPDAKAAEITSIRVLTYEGDPILDPLISAFYERNKQIRVDKVFYPVGPTAFDGLAVLRERIGAGAIDIFPQMAVPGDLVAENLILALDPYVKKTGLDLRPYESVLSPFRVDGRLYMLPSYGIPEVIFYNADMFATAGLTPPRPGWTWDEFRVAAAKLTSGSGESKVWGMGRNGGVESLAYHMATERAAGQAIEPPVAKEILTFWSTMLHTDKSLKPSPRRAPDGSRALTGSPFQDFENRKAAMTLASMNTYQWLGRGSSFTVDIAPMPVSPGAKPGLTLYPSSYGIAANSPNADAAWEFLRFMLSDEAGVALVKAGYFPLVRTEAVKQAWFDRQPTPPRSTEHFFTAELRVNPYSTDSKASAINRALTKALQTLLQGETDQVTLYQQFTAEREKILAGQ